MTPDDGVLMKMGRLAVDLLPEEAIIESGIFVAIILYFSFACRRPFRRTFRRRVG